MACSLLLSFSTNAHAGPDADDFYEIENFGEAMIGVLEKLPYVKEGSGPIMFTFEFSECPYCQGMYRDYKAEMTGLEHRRVFVPVSDRSAKEAAAMGKSRSIQDYHAFMTGRKQAPVFNQDQASIDAYNSILDGVKAVEGILQQNQWPRQGLVFPQFIWVENGKVFTSAGYEKSDFGKAVARAKKGGGTVDAWAKLTEWMKTPQAEAAQTAPHVSTGIDVVGIEIGMTKDQVLAALKAYDPRLKIYEHNVKIVTQDSNKQQFEIGSYLKGIRADLVQGIPGFNVMNEPTEEIVIYFSPPPAAHRVEFVGREVTYPQGKGPDFEMSMQSIANKYGEPTEKQDKRSTNNGNGVIIQIWQEKGNYLNGEPFIRFSNKSGLMAPLNLQTSPYHPLALQQPPVSQDITGLNFGVVINKQGKLAQIMRFMLTADKQQIEKNQAATWNMGITALQQHEQKIKGAAQQRGGPRL